MFTHPWAKKKTTQGWSFRLSRAGLFVLVATHHRGE
jgi:hypothetical protein